MAGHFAKWPRCSGQTAICSFKNAPYAVVNNLVTEEDLENVELEMEGAINSGNASGNEAPVMAVEPSENPEGLAGNNYAIIFCVVCGKECSAAHSCGSCGKDVHAVCGMNTERKLLANYVTINK